MAKKTQISDLVYVPTTLKELIKMLKQLPDDLVLKVGYVNDVGLISKLTFKDIPCCGHECCCNKK